MDKKGLLQAIEGLREELKNLSPEDKDFLDREVLEKSRELDKLLVEYMKLLQDK